MPNRPLPVRTRLAVIAGAAAGRTSRALGRGAGATLPGAVTLRLAPSALADLAADRETVVVSGTNGKTTTTAFLVAALGTAEPIVTNTTGANLPTGVVAALAHSSAGRAVLETDELHVPRVIRDTRPAVLVLLNLSRDQLDRTHEVRRAADLWRTALAGVPIVVANAADPNIVYAVTDANPTPATVVWVDGGLRWLEDAEVCPRCGELLEVEFAGEPHARWRCRCGLRQPDADYRIDGGRLVTPHDGSIDLAPSLPGAANLSNAAFAVAAAVALGVGVGDAARRLARVDDVAGRYSTVRLGPRGGESRPARLLLAKNPAGWTVALDLIEDDAVVALGVNARTADGTDTSWLWDVPFERLAGRTVGVFGDRAADLELRLVHADVTTVRVPGDDAGALASTLPAGALTVLATYTAFEEVRQRV